MSYYYLFNYRVGPFKIEFWPYGHCCFEYFLKQRLRMQHRLAWSLLELAFRVLSTGITDTHHHSILISSILRSDNFTLIQIRAVLFPLSQLLDYFLICGVGDELSRRALG